MPPDSAVGFAIADWALLVLTGMFLLATVTGRPLLQQAFSRLAKRTPRCMALLFLLPILWRLLLLPHHPAPTPDSPDEFSNLLMADTLLHGRLTNPPHVMPEFFETLRSSPSLAMGLTLALGQFVSGEPWTGVLLASGAFCAATYWMLCAWVTPELALLGGIFAVMEFGPLCAWTNSYSGGYPAAIGGCLIFGMLPRLRLERNKLLRMAVWTLAALTPLLFLILLQKGTVSVPLMASFMLRLGYQVRFYRFFFLPPLYLALVGFLFSLREARMRWVAAALAILGLGANFFPYLTVNYLAGATCLFLLASVAGLEQVGRMKALGPDIARILIVLCIAEFAALHFDIWNPMQYGSQQRRIQVNRNLEAMKGQLLIFVRYSSRHSSQNEWVWNKADIDSARVIYAHDLGPEKNARLIRYYANRKVLLLEPDEFVPRLAAYNSAVE